MITVLQRLLFIFYFLGMTGVLAALQVIMVSFIVERGRKEEKDIATNMHDAFEDTCFQNKMRIV